MIRLGRGQLAVLTLAFVVGILGAVLFGFRLGREAVEVCLPPQATAPSVPPSVAGAITLDADQARTITAEVAKLVAAQGCPTPIPKQELADTVPADRPASPEAKRAKQELQQLLDRAFSAGEWTDKDVSVFRSLVFKLAPPDRTEMMNALFDGLNSKRLARQFRGPPM